MKRILKALSIGGSLRRKISLVLLAAIVLIFPPIMGAVDHAARQSIEQRVMDDRMVEMRVNAAALSKPLYDFDYANVQRMASVIAGRSEVDHVEVLDASGSIAALAPTGTRRGRGAEAESITIAHLSNGEPQHVGALRIWFNTHAATVAIRDFYWRTGLVITASLAVIFCALMVALRQVMLRPLDVLMAAIEKSAAGGERALAQWRSGDEMGRLVDHFNAMQLRLSFKEEKLKSALSNLSALYNQTPAMLFSLDEHGMIDTVSDYWALETGYSREEAVGRPISDFLYGCGGKSFSTKGDIKDPVAPSGFNRCNCKFRKKDGVEIDVYVSEAQEPLRVGERRRGLLVMVDISELKRAEAQLLCQARTDSLTGLPNRRHFKERLTEELERAEGDGSRLDVFFIDLDRFKWINDHLGHHAGDEVLSLCSERMRAILPEEAFFARLGGDEFAIFIAGADQQAAAALSRSVNEALEKPFRVCGSSLTISASIGVATFPDNATNVGGMLRAADLAMYRTKRAGRRGFSKYEDSIGDEARRLFEIEELMKTGSANERFYLDFQPIVRLFDQRIVGAEGLLRMRDAEGKVVPPNDFIPVAEEVGLMPELGAYALERGTREFADVLGGPGARPPRLAINLSAVQVTEDLPEQVMETLERTGFPPNRLVLEITESLFLKHEAGLLSILERIQSLGCRLALDDFGTGYSSLSYLNDFPVDIVKIDREFIRRLDGDGGARPNSHLQHRARALLQGVVTIAQELHFETVAEGVETEHQLQLVREMGIDYGQGYLWSKPIDRAAFIDRLAKQTLPDALETSLAGAERGERLHGRKRP